jgi:hypothetical protein
MVTFIILIVSTGWKLKFNPVFVLTTEIALTIIPHCPLQIALTVIPHCPLQITLMSLNPSLRDKKPVQEVLKYISIKQGCGPGSSLGIVTGYGLDGPGIESRWGTRFSAPVQTGHEAHTSSCTMGTGSFPGVESGRGVTMTPHPF